MTERIGKYELLEIKSNGAFGICYKAKDDNNNIYAIKKILVKSKNHEKLIQNEIYILKAMKSKYSVEFIEYLKKGDYYYIVMELCDDDLNYLIEKKKITKDIITIIKILIQLNEVLNLMHSKKIEHRDLKPQNILIKYKNENKNEFDIKLTDYGAAR